MTGRASGARPRLEVVNGSRSQADPVRRLHRFQAEYPQVKIIAPQWGGPGRYVAQIPADTIPGDPREAVVSSPDLAGLMDQLDDCLPSRRGNPSPEPA